MRSPRDTFDRLSAWLLIALGGLVLLSGGSALVGAARDGSWGNIVFVLTLLTIVALGVLRGVRQLQRLNRRADPPPPGGRRDQP